MSNLNVIETKISQIQKYLKLLERYKKYSKEEIEQNPDLKGIPTEYVTMGVTWRTNLFGLYNDRIKETKITLAY